MYSATILFSKTPGKQVPVQSYKEKQELPSLLLAGNYLFKVNKKSTRTMCGESVKSQQ